VARSPLRFTRTASDDQRPRKDARRHGSKRQRSPGSWEFKVYSRARRRYLWRTVRADSERDAELKLTEFWLEAQKGEVVPTGRSTAADYVDRWLASHGKKVRVTTLRGYEQAVRLYIKPAIGHVVLAKLKAIQVDEMYDRLLARGLSPTTVVNVHRAGSPQRTTSLFGTGAPIANRIGEGRACAARPTFRCIEPRKDPSLANHRRESGGRE
jgi:hypothetical protein